jgi:hypothetical protein
VLDLIGPGVQVTRRRGDRNETVIVDSPFPNLPTAMKLYLPMLLENVAANANPTIPGRININQAPRTVLEGIPGMTTEMVDQILSKRQPEQTDDQKDRQSETWLMTEEIVTLEQMKAMIPFVTAGGSVFQAQIVGYFEQGGPAARVEAVFDTSGEAPRLLFWRDLGHLGRGYTLSTLGVSAAQ